MVALLRHVGDTEGGGAGDVPFVFSLKTSSVNDNNDEYEIYE